MVKDLSLIVVPGSNSGKAFSDIFLSLSDCSIRVPQPCNLQLFTFCFVTF